MKHIYLLLVAIAAISCAESQTDILKERFNKTIVEAYAKELCAANDMSVYTEYEDLTSDDKRKNYIDSLEIRVRYGMKIGKQDTLTVKK